MSQLYVSTEPMEDLETVEFEPVDILTLTLSTGQTSDPHCAQCFSLLSFIYYWKAKRNAEPDREKYMTYNVRHSRFSSAESKCPICDMVSSEFNARFRRDSTLGCDITDGNLVDYWDWIWTFGWSADKSVISVSFHALPDYGYRKKYNEGVWMDARLDMACELSAVPAATQASDYDQEIKPDVKKVHGWLNNCIETHHQCRCLFNDTNSEWFPDRLVYYDTSSEQPIFRLVCKNDDTAFANAEFVEGRLSYVALSHSWGPPPNSKLPNGGRVVLTKSNIESWCISLPQNIAKTQADALDLMVKLGKRFMWLDSLCIIMQDSVEDWNVQAAVMGDVYRYATFTIASLTGMSDEEGFFTRPSQYRFPAEFLGLPGQDISLKWIDGENEAFSLHGRAWTYQERELSRRTIGVSLFEYQWACDEVRDRELENIEMQRGMKNFNTLRLPQSALREYMHRSDDKSSRDASSVWAECVRIYCECALTFEADKLVAIGAIAQQLAGLDHQMGRYFAGLWEDRFVQHLLWFVKKPGRKSQDESVPSWSWLSIGIPCELKTVKPVSAQSALMLAEMLHVRTPTVSDVEFGSITSGTARIRGCLRSVSSYIRRSDGGYGRYRLVDAETGFFVACRPDTIDLQQSDFLHWMPIIIRSTSVRYAGMQLVFEGLVLLEIASTQSDLMQIRRFQRIGYCSFKYPDLNTSSWSKDLVRNTMKLFAGFQQDVLTDSDQIPTELSTFQPRSKSFEEFDLV